MFDVDILESVTRDSGLCCCRAQTRKGWGFVRTGHFLSLLTSALSAWCTSSAVLDGESKTRTHH